MKSTNRCQRDKRSDAFYTLVGASFFSDAVVKMIDDR